MYSKINRNIYKPPVAEATKEIVRKNFTREIEFFEFCKQRLHKQYLALNLNENQPWNTNGFKKDVGCVSVCPILPLNRLKIF